MAKDPAFLFYPGDYLRDTQCLSANAQVAYDRIMCEHMRNICITQAQLKFFTKRLTDDDKAELLNVLHRTREGYQIPWVVDAITKRREYSENRRKNRQGKTNKKNNISKTYVPHMENEIENEIESKDYIIIESEKNFNPINVLEFYEAALNGRQHEHGGKSWRALVPVWFKQNVGIEFNNAQHVLNSFSRFYINSTRSKKIVGAVPAKFTMEDLERDSN